MTPTHFTVTLTFYDPTDASTKWQKLTYTMSFRVPVVRGQSSDADVRGTKLTAVSWAGSALRTGFDWPKTSTTTVIILPNHIVSAVVTEEVSG